MTKNRSCTGKIRHETRAAADNHLRFLRRIDRLLPTWLRAAGPDPALSLAYRERAQLLALLASIYPSQIQPDPAEPDWQVLYLRLPTGQTTRHIAPGDVELFTHPGGGRLSSARQPGGREVAGLHVPLLLHYDFGVMQS